MLEPSHDRLEWCPHVAATLAFFGAFALLSACSNDDTERPHSDGGVDGLGLGDGGFAAGVADDNDVDDIGSGDASVDGEPAGSTSTNGNSNTNINTDAGSKVEPMVDGGQTGGSDGTPPMDPPSEGECDVDGHCSDARAYCDLEEHACVQCRDDGDCDAFEVCEEQNCTGGGGCLDHDDCGDQLCEFARGECVECRNAEDCDEEQACEVGECVGVDTCVNSLDCAPGLVCVNTSCVECGINADCPDDNSCFDNTCHMNCDSDNDCTPLGLLCDTVAGACFRCLVDADCDEADFCSSGECAPDVCPAERTFCEGTLLFECLTNGSGSVQQACLATQSCATVAGTAQCQDHLCVPDSLGCVDEDASYVCNSDGFSYASITNCDADDVCLGGECLPRVCSEEGALLCSADAVLRCTSQGTATVVEDTCMWYEECDEAQCTMISGPSGNLVGDGDFSSGGVGWNVLDDAGLSSLPFDASDGALCVTLTTSDLEVNVGWPQAIADALVLPDSVYEFSFEAWAAVGGVVTVEAKVGQAASPFTSHVVELSTLDDTPTNYLYEFSPLHSSASGVNFQFTTGSANAPMQVCIDNVVLQTTFE